MDPGSKSFDLSGGAANGVCAHVDVKIGLGEERAVACDPGLADHFTVSVQHLLDQSAADVAAIDVQLGDDIAAGQVGNVVAKHGSRFFFRTIRGCDGAGEDQLAVEVGGDMALVAVEPLAFALSAVAHLAVMDRDAPLGRHPSPDA